MTKKIIPIVLLVIAVIVVLQLKSRERHSTSENSKHASEEQQEGASTHTTPAEIPLPKLLDLGAGKCVPCKMMAPILEEMKETYAGQFDVEFIDVWENEEAGKKYGIRMIPTQIFYNAEGKELFRHEGFFDRADMLAQWNTLGFHFSEAK